MLFAICRLSGEGRRGGGGVVRLGFFGKREVYGLPELVWGGLCVVWR
jgi:hypothetical protein